ncbi:unnamed protein product [Meganyctiphanes norvegica]|uniref:glutathione transferase n=1 Tax=Meganyctiphanes norvegica TaxID=48144 RepID=A0AAV2QNN9_MEGNR
MPDYKLIYFNLQARAELTRWCFAYGGIPYEDDRIEGTWVQRKKEMPAGKIPVLYVDGKPLTESLAIARYAAKQAGLVPRDDLQAAYCDAMVDTMAGEVLHTIYQHIVFGKDEPAEKQRKLKEDLVPKWNPILKRLNERLSNQDWFISDRVTWVDLAISFIFGKAAEHYPKLLNDYPNVNKVVENVQNLKPIKKWISTRPKTN